MAEGKNKIFKQSDLTFTYTKLHPTRGGKVIATVDFIKSIQKTSDEHYHITFKDNARITFNVNNRFLWHAMYYFEGIEMVKRLRPGGWCGWKEEVQEYFDSYIEQLTFWELCGNN